MGLFGFGRRKYASVAVAGSTAIRVSEPDGRATTIDIALVKWLSFLQVGDETTNVYEGWWLLGWRDFGIAVLAECGTIDLLLRDAAFADLIDRIDDKTLIFTATRPSKLDGSAAKHGVVHLNADEVVVLRHLGSHERVRSVNDFPRIL